MRLSKFILTNLEEILTEWELFAGTVLPGTQFDRAALRNDAAEMLATIARDMETPQTKEQQTAKSKGHGPKTAQDTSAEKHSLVRLGQGFNQVQALAEFRALRATVIRLWMSSSPELDDSAMYQLIRFNEGIDQALSESVARFMEQIEASRDFAIAVLAHDLRNPLNAILSSAQLLQITESIDRATVGEIATNIIDSGTQMSKLINNLLDFTRTRLGRPLPVKQEEMDLVPVCRQTVAELVAAYPERTIDLNCPKSLLGKFDVTRIGQMLSNLIANAIQHGDPATPVTVTVSLESDRTVFRVHNEGAPLPESVLQTIFDLTPRRRKEDQKPEGESSHLGIGLFIVKQIVEAHFRNGKRNFHRRRDHFRGQSALPRKQGRLAGRGTEFRYSPAPSVTECANSAINPLRLVAALLRRRFQPHSNISENPEEACGKKIGSFQAWELRAKFLGVHRWLLSSLSKMTRYHGAALRIFSGCPGMMFMRPRMAR